MTLGGFRRAAMVVVSVGALMALGATVPAAGNPNEACDQVPYPDDGNGANHSGTFDDTCDGSPSGNGSGGGNAKGKPCAGCVGNADEKNPKGQYNNDKNNGYECDGNNGIGKTNPAHTGCADTGDDDDDVGDDDDDDVVGDDDDDTDVLTERETRRDDDDTDVLGVRLAKTGSPNMTLLALGLLLIGLGAASLKGAAVVRTKR